MQAVETRQPLRVAVIGSGPSAFYAAEDLLRSDAAKVEVDMFERLPMPFGLVRYGVAPDHQKIKEVTRAFEKTARDPRFRFFGGVGYGRDVWLEDLRKHYDAVVFGTGAQADRRMGIPGEDLEGSHSATAFVAWYNGHPDYRDMQFDLSSERAIVVGVGNVALDVARILSLSKEELLRTDIPDYAVAALLKSRVREVHVIGRRGPAQAAFSAPELKEFGEIAEASVHTLPEEVRLDARSRHDAEMAEDPALMRRLEILQSYAEPAREKKTRRVYLRFLLSPLELIEDGNGRVSAARLGRNTLERTEGGSLAARATGEEMQMDTGLVLRAVGYKGTEILGLPFDNATGVVPNIGGRVMDPESGDQVPGIYVTGWIKRGPTGVIGTNKPDAAETVENLVADLVAGGGFAPEEASAQASLALVAQRQPDFVSFGEWKTIDRLERERGRRNGKPRVKFTSAAELKAALAEARSGTAA
ncbi:MAG TPA: FAD-dependent oxidoreductase [Tepidiformaceae bacterium]|nr:FAD-dependent oxidoreductase [Tepidiformaceae bacterium]